MKRNPRRLILLCALALAAFPSIVRAASDSPVPVFEITPATSSIKFFVKSSVSLLGTFDKWESSLKFTSPAAESGQLTIKIEASSVNTGSGMKDGKLKSKDFFNVDQDPYITFVSKKVVQTGPTTFDLQGDFTIRGVTKTETLSLTLEGKGTGSGTIKGTMAFDRKDYGMTKGIPFIKIADRVEVTVNLKGKLVAGPKVVFKQ